MPETFSITPIGHIVAARPHPTDDAWDDVAALITLDAAQFTPEAIAGVSTFSHIEVLFVFHRVDLATVEHGARIPRGNPAWPRVGIFAQRGKNRPNRLGATICEIVNVEGLNITVRGLDAIDGTPVIDIKPVMREFLPRTPVKQPDWATELMKGYW